MTYADDLVILCRKGNADEALQQLRKIMSKLKLTVNEEKTRICKVPEKSSTFWVTRSDECIRREPAILQSPLTRTSRLASINRMVNIPRSHALRPYSTRPYRNLLTVKRAVEIRLRSEILLPLPPVRLALRRTRCKKKPHQI